MAKQPPRVVAFSVDLIESVASAVRAEGGDQLATLEALRLAVEERLLRAALEGAGWSLQAAARALGKPEASAIMRALARHPALQEEWERRSPPAIGEWKRR